MCIGCYTPIMTLDLPSLEASPAMLIPINSSAKTNTSQAQPQMSVTDVQAVIKTLIHNLPNSTQVPMLRQEFAAIYQRLTCLTDKDQNEQVSTVVGEGLLSIADYLGTLTQADRVHDVLVTKQAPNSNNQVSNSLLPGQSNWGILS